MAIVANTFLTYSAIGNREDLTDFITNISPTETPVLTRIRKVKASAVTHDFQTDELAAAASNAVVEGNDATFPALTATTRLTNTCQIMAKYLIVSGTQDVVNKAGRKSETSYQLGKKGAELARDMEYGILQNSAVVSGNSTTARQFKGIAGWITTNTTAKASADVAQTDLDDAMSDIWNEGGAGPKMLVCHSHNKKTISGFTTGVTKNLDADDKRLVYSVDVYEPPIGGVMTIVPDHFISTSSIFILNPELWSVAYLRRLRVEPLAKTGDATKKQLLVEFTIESRQEKGNAAITGTSTS